MSKRQPEVDSSDESSFEEISITWKRVATLGHGATAEVSVWENEQTKKQLAIKVRSFASAFSSHIARVDFGGNI